MERQSYRLLCRNIGTNAFALLCTDSILPIVNLWCLQSLSEIENICAPISVHYATLFHVLCYLRSTISRLFCTVLIRLFLYELILTLNEPMIHTHVAPPQASIFFWVPLSFLGVASVRMLCLDLAPRPNTLLWLILL